MYVLILVFSTNNETNNDIRVYIIKFKIKDNHKNLSLFFIHVQKLQVVKFTLIIMSYFL